MLKRMLGLALSGALALTAGCDDGGSGDDGGDPIMIPDAMVDMAPVEEMDPHRDYCRARAEAVCAWGFECLGGGGGLTAFDLTGPTEADCADAAFDACYGPLIDQVERGTVDFRADGGEVCAMRLRSSPCLDGSPSAWVGMWQDYVQQWCGNVARGIVPSGDACAVQADCATPADACVDGTCAEIPPASLVQACDARGDLGVPQLDESCPTGTCVPVTGGAICSASCAGARGCGPGGLCLRATTLAGTIRTYCVRSCGEEGDPICGEGFACNLITEDGDDRICEPMP